MTTMSAPTVSLARFRRSGRDGRGLVIAAALIAAGLLAPLVLIVIQAQQSGWSAARHVLFRQLTLTLLEHTVSLAALVFVGAVVIGVAVAWCTERGGIGGRRVWTALLVMPVAIPDFATGYAWHSIAPTMNGLAAATLVMVLSSYPLVYLPVAAALRRSDPAMEDAARSLGATPWEAFRRVTLPLIRPALIGGGVLVVLTVLSEYGAFEILRFQTFTTEIFTEASYPAIAGALTLPLVLLGVLVLSVEAFLPKRVISRNTPARKVAPPRQARAVRVGIQLGLLLLTGLAIGVPIGTIFYWMASSQQTTLPAASTLSAATWTTLRYSAAGAGIAVAAAIPVALVTFRRVSRPRIALIGSTYLTQAVPGVALALALDFLALHYLISIYDTGLLLVIAYAILHFPLALACVRTSVAQAPANLADVGRSLGRSRPSVFLRVTIPLLAPGLVAGFCLVFLTAVTELTATLLLAPIGVQTLATQFWAFQQNDSYGAAAPYALMIVILAVIPGALLGLWFDRQRFQAPSA